MKTLAVVVALACMCKAFDFDYIRDTQDPPAHRLYVSLTYASAFNNLYVFGGQKDNSHNFNDVWVYSLNKDQWRMETSAAQVYPSKV